VLHRVGSVFVVQSLFTDFELLFLERRLPPSGTDLALAVQEGIRRCSTTSVYSLLQRLSSQKAIGFNKAGPLLKHGA
jgi:DNA-binding PadR family transcriptional regulator